VADEKTNHRNAMSFPELLSWAWSETPPVHKRTANLLIHIFAVPLFVVGHVLFVASLFSNKWLLVAALGCIVVSLALQTFGHSLEKDKPPPFEGPRDFVRRLYAEQFCNFWRFVFSGKWYASLRSRNDA
jgi:hypothetical protein